jgi:hypothetical protein
MNASLHRKARLPFLKPDLALTRFLLVILMIVKEASYLSFEWRRLLQILQQAFLDRHTGGTFS